MLHQRVLDEDAGQAGRACFAPRVRRFPCGGVPEYADALAVAGDASHPGGLGVWLNLATSVR